jgi:hypothetical protein
MDHEGAMRAAVIAEHLHSEAVERAAQLSAALTRTARSLEWSAALADEHAKRRELDGRHDEAANERAVARRASDAARRARVRAEQLARMR